MSIHSETTSSLLEKYILILIELQRLNALFMHYSHTGAEARVAQVADSLKRLELSKSTISLEIDKRLPNENKDYLGTEDSDSPSS